MESSVFSLGSLTKDTPEKLQLNAKEGWLAKVLAELNESAGAEETQMLEKAHLTFTGEIKKSKNIKFGEYLVISGDLSTSFITQCVKTGAMMIDQVECLVKAGCISRANQKQLGLEDGDSIFLEDEEFELFFYENNQVDLEPILSEFIYLNKNAYPSTVGDEAEDSSSITLN